MGSDRLGLNYALFYGGQFVLLGMQLPFLAGWFVAEGFAPVAIGWITGVSLIARFSIGPFVAVWADKQTDERKPLRVVSAVFAIGALTMAVMSSKIIIALGAVMVMWSFGILTPLTDSAVLRADRAGRLHFGQMRAVGSTFFLLTSIIGGFVLSFYGIEAVVWIMAGAAMIAFAAALALPRERQGTHVENDVRPVAWADAPRLLRNPVFVFAIASAGLTQGAHAVYYGFSYIRWSELGIADTSIGWLWATGVIAEIFVLVRARNVMRKLHPALLLAIGAIGAIIRWTLTAAEPSLALLFVLQMLHAATFAVTYLGGLEFVMRAVPARLVNTSMTIMSTLGVGAITGAATLGAGYLWEIGGPAQSYLAMSLMGVGALICAMALGRSWDGGKVID